MGFKGLLFCQDIGSIWQILRYPEGVLRFSPLDFKLPGGQSRLIPVDPSVFLTVPPDGIQRIQIILKKWLQILLRPEDGLIKSPVVYLVPIGGLCSILCQFLLYLVLQIPGNCKLAYRIRPLCIFPGLRRGIDCIFYSRKKTPGKGLKGGIYHLALQFPLVRIRRPDRMEKFFIIVILQDSPFRFYRIQLLHQLWKYPVVLVHIHSRSVFICPCDRSVLVTIQPFQIGS